MANQRIRQGRSWVEHSGGAYCLRFGVVNGMP